MLPKTHKKTTPIPTRPIVAGCSGPNENISRFLSFLLNPVVKKIKSYVRDSKHLVNIIESTPILTNSLLVTKDVGSLYTNIPQDGVEVAFAFMRKFSKEVSFSLPEEVIREMLQFVLKHNIFNFNGKTYRQKYGTRLWELAWLPHLQSYPRGRILVRKIPKTRNLFALHRRHIPHVAPRL